MWAVLAFQSALSGDPTSQLLRFALMYEPHSWDSSQSPGWLDCDRSQDPQPQGFKPFLSQETPTPSLMLLSSRWFYFRGFVALSSLWILFRQIVSYWSRFLELESRGQRGRVSISFHSRGSQAPHANMPASPGISLGLLISSLFPRKKC